MPTMDVGFSLEITVVEANARDRRGIELVLTSWGHRIIGLAESAEVAFDLIRKRKPEVALVGMDLSDAGGFRLVRRLLALDPRLGVVLVPRHASTDELEEALACGARGIVLRSGAAAELASAVAIVGAGGKYVSPGAERQASALAQLGVLSRRERELLQLLAHGLTGSQAAVRLAVSRDAVRADLRNAMRKLRARTRVHAVAIAIKRQEIWS